MMLDKFYEQLAIAIIAQAANDYMVLIRTGKEHMSKSARNWNAGAGGVIVSRKELESFFHSKWYGQLTTLDPDYLMRMLKKHAFDSRIRPYRTNK